MCCVLHARRRRWQLTLLVQCTFNEYAKTNDKKREGVSCRVRVRANKHCGISLHCNPDSGLTCVCRVSAAYWRRSLYYIIRAKFCKLKGRQHDKAALRVAATPNLTSISNFNNWQVYSPSSTSPTLLKLGKFSPV